MESKTNTMLDRRLRLGESKSLFITGTDTGIGKTVVATTFCRGLGIQYWKPIQTGPDLDSDFLRQWIPSHKVMPESYRLREPLSPHLSAARDGVTIDLSKILSDFNGISGDIIVEGAGGVLVPLNDNLMMVDLIKEINIPVVLVTSTRLGTINHTLLTVEALRRRSIEIYGIVTIGEKKIEINETLGRLSGIVKIGHISIVNKWTQAEFDQIFQNLNGLFSESGTQFETGGLV